MRINDMRFIWDYYYWATWKLLGAAEGLGDAEFEAPAPGGRSLREILVHTLSAERGWRTAFIAREDIQRLDPADFPSVASLAERWRAEEARMHEFLGGLDDGGLDKPFEEDYPLWQFLSHVANHGTQHRSEAALILTDLDRSPGDLDMVDYIFREQQVQS